MLFAAARPSCCRFVRPPSCCICVVCAVRPKAVIGSFGLGLAVSACFVQKAQARMEEIAAQLAATNDPSEIDRLGRLLQASLLTEPLTLFRSEWRRTRCLCFAEQWPTIRLQLRTLCIHTHACYPAGSIGIRSGGRQRRPPWAVGIDDRFASAAWLAKLR